MTKIVTLTINPTIDRSTYVDRVVPDRKLRCAPPRDEPGGGGVNVSRAIKRLGGQSRAIYAMGGATGDMLRSLLDAEALDHQPLAIRDLTRLNLMVLDESSDRQFRFGMPGPQLDKTEWERCLDAVASVGKDVDYIVGSGSLPRGVPDDFYAQVADLGREAGARVIVDTAGEPLRLAAEAGVYMLKPNMRELGHLAHHDIEDEEEQVAVAEDIVQRGWAEVVMVTLGAAGALLATADGTRRFRAPTVQIHSKIGAGDSTVAGGVLSLAQGKSLEDAVRYGIAAGSAAVMTPGTELCRKEDTERLYERIQSGDKEHS